MNDFERDRPLSSVDSPRHSFANWRILLLLATGLLGATGCNGCSQTPEPAGQAEPSRQSEASTGAAAGVTGTGSDSSTISSLNVGAQIAPPIDPASPRVMVVELVELNQDTLPGRLLEEDDAHGDDAPPLEIAAGRLLLHEVPKGDDDFDAPSLVVEPAGTPSAQCRLFVIHTIHYAGVGRVDVSESYYAFASPPATVVRPQTLAGDAFEYDPNVGGIPLETAIFSLRVYPDDVAKIDLTGEGDALVVTAGATTRKLAPGEQADLFTSERKVAVRQKPLLSTAATEVDDLFDTAPPALPGPAREIAPGRDYGQPTFSTKLTVTYHGLLPLQSEPHAPLPEPKP